MNLSVCLYFFPYVLVCGGLMKLPIIAVYIIIDFFLLLLLSLATDDWHRHFRIQFILFIIIGMKIAQTD